MPAPSTQNRYFDVVVEYAKQSASDILDSHHGAQPRTGTADRSMCSRRLWFRNTWSWEFPGRETRTDARRTTLSRATGWPWHVQALRRSAARRLFTENETNGHRLFGAAASAATSRTRSTSTSSTATMPRSIPGVAEPKAAAHHRLTIPAGEPAVVATPPLAGWTCRAIRGIRLSLRIAGIARRTVSTTIAARPHRRTATRAAAGVRRE